MKYKFKTYSRSLLALSLIVWLAGCELQDLDINTDPNNANEASLNLLLTSSEIGGISIFGGGLNDNMMGFQGLISSADDFNFTNNSYNGTWAFLYNGPLKDLNEMINASSSEVTPHYLGIGQLLKAYYFTTMVDLWGDIPYTEAFKGDADEPILEPIYDNGASIYADAFRLINEARSNLALSQAVSVNGDIMYGGSVSKWITMANTLELKLLLNTKNVANNTAAIQALVDGGNLITDPKDNFEARYGSLRDPESRHPQFQQTYAAGEAGYSYFTHQFMFEMLRDRDPRTPFYFKRQTSITLNPDDPTDKQTLPCSQRSDCVYSYFPLSPLVTNGIYGVDPDALNDDQIDYLSGFFGRDRSDPSGIPNDNPLRTTVGTYPAAGLFDSGTPGPIGGDDEGKGDGIFPIMTSWMVKFYLLEAQITMGVSTGMSETELLQSALEDQFARVIEIGTASDPTANANISTWPDLYDWPIEFKTDEAFIGDIIAAYPTGSQNQRLGYVLKQAWKANYGNGFDGYNSFRRTGLPADIQTPLQLARQYALSLPYAQDEYNLNTNTPEKVYDSPTGAIFWDTLKFQF